MTELPGRPFTSGFKLLAEKTVTWLTGESVSAAFRLSEAEAARLVGCSQQSG